MTKHLVAMMAFLAAVTIFPGSANATPKGKTTAKPAPKEWTFLVFLNGHNNLDPYGMANIKQMEEVGSNDKVNIVVQWASYANTNTQRMLIQKSTDPSQVTSPILQELPPVDMGDVKELEKFMLWGAQNFPAKHYFVNVWNHGNGWHLKNQKGQLFSISGMKPTDISYDDRTGHHISTEELGQSMQTFAQAIGHKVDIYGSDACLMAMAEVTGEMMSSVDYYVGSEEVEPGEGWPYNTFLNQWLSKKTSSPREVAMLLSKDYLAAYSGGIYGSQDVTMSAMDLNQLPNFHQAVSRLSAELIKMNPAEIKKTMVAAKGSQAWTLPDYKDLGDFLARLGQQTTVASQREAIQSVNSALAELVISNDVSPSFHAHGVAVWVPTNASDYRTYSDRYRGLAFAKATGWGEFLQLLNTK